MKVITRNWISVAVATVTLIVFIPYLFHFADTTWTNDINLWGSFGDYIGGTLGVSLTLLSVILIYMTYKDQKQHINKIESSLQDQANRSEFISINESLFNILDRKDKHLGKVMYVNLNNRNIKGTSYSKDDVYYGDEALTVMIAEMRLEISELDSKPTTEQIIEIRGRTYHFSAAYLIPFVKCISSSLLLIHNSNLNSDQKDYLYDVLEISLSIPETTAYLIGLNISYNIDAEDKRPDKPKLYELAEKSGMIQNIYGEDKLLFIEWKEEPEEN